MRMANLPQLTVDGITYQPKGQPVLVWFPGGEVFEFPTVEAAWADVKRRQFEEWPGAHFARVFRFQEGAWLETRGGGDAA
jgi:hypothetical protein